MKHASRNALRRNLMRLGVAAIVTTGGSCSSAPLANRSPAEEAAKTFAEDRCEAPDVQETALVPIFENGVVEASQPIYTAVTGMGAGAGGNYSQLIGASLKVTAIRGFTAEWLDRALECHSARRVLGKIPESWLPDDPFWLPGKTVDIEVAVDRAEFAVNVRGKNVNDAEAILSRANHYVEAHGRR